MLHLVVTDTDTVTAHGGSLKELENFGQVTYYGLTRPHEVAQRIADADIVLCNKTPLTAETLSAARRLRYIGLFATGYNNVDITYTNDRGITVCNVPGYSTNAVAQHTFALILALSNQVDGYQKLVANGEWVKSRTFSFFPLPLRELSGKTLGIVGYGAIGRQVANIAKSFGMRVLVCNRSPVQDATVTQVSFPCLLADSDIVSLHCPLNKDSAGMMNREAFFSMKSGSMFINTARGPLVDESALKDALENGHLAGAGLDVLCQEPMSADCPLRDAPNCYITPHVAWAAQETRERLLKIVIENIRSFLNGTPIHTVS